MKKLILLICISALILSSCVAENETETMVVVTSMLLLVIDNFICGKEVKNYEIIEN